jgi:hypothetical protein
MKSLIATGLCGILLPSLVAAVPYVTSEGSNFIVEGSNNRFDIIGVE